MRQVPPDRIVEPVDASGHRALGLAAGLPGSRPDQFGLDGSSCQPSKLNDIGSRSLDRDNMGVSDALGLHFLRSQ